MFMSRTLPVPGGDREHSDQHLMAVGLAAAVGADQAEGASSRDFQRQVIDAQCAAEPLGEAEELDGRAAARASAWVGHGRAPRRARRLCSERSELSLQASFLMGVYSRSGAARWKAAAKIFELVRLYAGDLPGGMPRPMRGRAVAGDRFGGRRPRGDEQSPAAL